jgi:hypothetical protein
MFFVIVDGKLTSSPESAFSTTQPWNRVKSCGQQVVPIGSDLQGQGWGYALGRTNNMRFPSGLSQG